MNEKTARLIRRASFKLREVDTKVKRQWLLVTARERGRLRRRWEKLVRR